MPSGGGWSSGSHGPLGPWVGAGLPGPGASWIRRVWSQPGCEPQAPPQECLGPCAHPRARWGGALSLGPQNCPLAALLSLRWNGGLGEPPPRGTLGGGMEATGQPTLHSGAPWGSPALCLGSPLMARLEWVGCWCRQRDHQPQPSLPCPWGAPGLAAAVETVEEMGPRCPDPPLGACQASPSGCDCSWNLGQVQEGQPGIGGLLSIAIPRVHPERQGTRRLRASVCDLPRQESQTETLWGPLVRAPCGSIPPLRRGSSWMLTYTWPTLLPGRGLLCCVQPAVTWPFPSPGPGPGPRPLAPKTLGSVGPQKCPCLDLAPSLLHQPPHSPWSSWTTSPAAPALGLTSAARDLALP